MQRWQLVLNGSVLRALSGGSADAAAVRPRFMSSEILMLTLARHHRLSSVIAAQLRLRLHGPSLRLHRSVLSFSSL